MVIPRWFALLFALVANVAAHGRPLLPEEVPEPLRPWTDWVLHEQDERACPLLFNANLRQCVWPSRIALDLRADQGEFVQDGQVYAESWVELPGDAKIWPQQVTVNGEPGLVSDREGRPAVRLSTGQYRIAGRFAWRHLPESLSIPPASGLLSLRIDGEPVGFPDLNREGQLWVRERDTGRKDREALGDRLELHVFRRVIDDHPMQVITRMELEVAGAQREILLGRALLDGFLPVRLDSPLPARLEADGRLRLQVRPGRWMVELGARHFGDVTRLPLTDSHKPWPAEEIWVWDARNHLRLVEVEGGTGVDPRQTTLPGSWQGLPAYRMHPGDTLVLKVLRRGDPEPEPDTLNLQRTLWLDFSGEGYTFQDRITGSMTRGWRLEANPEIELGRVVVDGQAQFITTRLDSPKKGVEVRRGAIDLIADSRYRGERGSLPAVGWDHDFQQVAATLHLPPGWKPFSARGVDNVPNTWVQRWTLLDLFLVLIAAIAVGRLWGWPWGLLALVTLSLIWHEPGAPRYVWLNILAAIALFRVLPPGRFRFAVAWYRNLSLAALALLALPFLVQEARVGLYPQLERPWATVKRHEPAIPRLAAPPMPTSRAMEEMAQDQHGLAAMMPRGVPSLERREKRSAELDSTEHWVQVDPKARIQTGPGLPQWQWTSIPLSWNGPVERDQSIGLILLSPAVNLVLNLSRMILLVWLAVRLLDRPLSSWRRPAPATGTAAALLLMIPLLTLVPREAAAEFPSQALLDELKTRLLAPPECLPACAQIPKMHLEVTPRRLLLRLEVHVLQDTAVPLPLDLGDWVPTQVMIDGSDASGLFRGPDGGLWSQISKGAHQITLSGPLPPRTRLQLGLPLKPHRVSAQTRGWLLDGIDEDGVPDAQLQLTRIRDESQQYPPEALEARALPPFARIERTLAIGLDWAVETRVIRVSPQGAPIVLKVPLLEGESVTTDGVRVKDREVLVSLTPQQSRVTWRSTLKKRGELVLTASDNPAWAEVWRADISPIWRAELSGIPVVHHRNASGRWLPEWRPWPGEQVRLGVTRPAGVEGQTLTIERSDLRVAPGQRATDATLALALRSSQGGQHTLRLPEQARLQSVSINGTAQPIRQDGQQVTLPVTPGEQAIELAWRQPEAMRSTLRTPAADLGADSVNSAISVRLGQDRWVLFAGGPRLGPAVLFWGVLIVIVVAAIGLARIRLTPLRTWQWLLLGIGLSQSPPWVAVIVVGWLLALGGRERLSADTHKILFDVAQLGLALLTVIALTQLFGAVQQGLLGTPQMQIAGNQSTAYQLNWYQDRIGSELPQAWVLSVPLWVYRTLMLVWALWLAFALLRWLRWGWTCFSTHGLWRELKRRPAAS